MKGRRGEMKEMKIERSITGVSWKGRPLLYDSRRRLEKFSKNHLFVFTNGPLTMIIFC